MKKVALVLLLFYSVLLSADYNYPDYQNLIQRYEQLVTLYPNRVQSQIIGQSQEEEQNIFAYKISNQNDESSKRNILIIGSIYAKDIPATNSTYLWAKELLESLNQNPTILNHINFWVIPSLNPDGYDISLNQNLYSYLNNGRDNNNNQILGESIDGVNLNRNFDFNWIHGPAYENMDNLYYRGEYAYSESETQSLINLVNEIKFEFCMINMTESSNHHTLTFPYRWYSVRPSPDFDVFELLAQNIISSIQLIDNEWIKMPNNERYGNILDDLYVSHNIIPFSLSYNAYSILPDSTQLTQQKNILKNAVSFVSMLTSEYSSISSTLPGVLQLSIKDANTLLPLDADIVIDQAHSQAFKQRKSNSLNGNYFRYLIPGEYQIQIYKKGYQSTSLQITINNNQMIQEQIALNPLQPSQVNFSVQFLNENVNTGIRIKNEIYEETLEVTNGNLLYNAYEGFYEISLLSDEFAPIKKEVYFNPGSNHFQFNMNYMNFSFSEEFEASCCSWIMNGPWLVVSDNSHNSHFITDSWSGNGFYEVNAQYTLQVSYPINLYGYDEQDLYLIFDHAIHTEWDNDYVSVELSFDNHNWNSLFKFAGKSEGWSKHIISLNSYKNNDVYLRFKLKDGNGNNPNHEKLVDPGWNLDNIKIVASTSSLNIEEQQIPITENIELHVYPNPFNPHLNISFSMSEHEQSGEIKIFNVKGQLIEHRSLSTYEIKQKRIIWNAEKSSSGIYFIQLITEHGDIKSKKALLLK